MSLTSVPETFSASWGTLLEDNKEYQGRVKIKINSSEEQAAKLDPVKAISSK